MTVSDSFKTGAVRPRYGDRMDAHLEAVGIVVKDMARSLAFYRMLGVDVPADSDDQPHVEATLGNGLKLMWDTEETILSFYPERKAPSGGSRMDLCFGFDSPAEVDAAYQELVDAGFHGEKAPWDAFWGQRYALVHDPDGNGIDLFAAVAT